MTELEILLPELVELESLHDAVARFGTITKETTVSYHGHELPIYSYAFGPTGPGHPTLIVAGGVHGLERIGTRVVTAYLRTVLALLEWDQSTRDLLKHTRLLFYPLVNPGGMMATTRCNPNGVDLMRNAPVDIDRESGWRIFEGHRISPRLPWYRGAAGAPMELEARTLCDFVDKQLATSSVVISVDVHSGFGAVDRLWFPYARAHAPFPRIAEAYRLHELFDRTYPNHVYRVEPQSKQYLTHGDLWDYLFDRFEETHTGRLYLPLSLEMGSWMWVKKNPRQLFSILGAFNPILPHRKQRTLRRHLFLFDFLLRAVHSAESWVAEKERDTVEEKAMTYWYGVKRAA